MKKTIILLLALMCTTAIMALNTDDPTGTTCKESPSGQHDYVMVSEEEATCTGYGRIVRECVFCRDQEEIISSDPLNHEYVQKEEGATCTTGRRTWKECTRCGDITDEESSGSGLGHDYVSKHRDGTCISASVDWDECTRCGNIINMKEGSTSSHTWVEDYTRDATCTESGFVYYRCSVCGAYSDFYDELSPVGHDYRKVKTVDATCVDDGYIRYRCLNCDSTYTTPVMATGVHDYRRSAVNRATCTEDGESTYTCSMCGDSYTKTLKATGHSYSKTGKTEATCTEDGYTAYTCANCGDVYKRSIKASGHKYVDRSSDATCTAKAAVWKECSVCGDVKDKVETGSALGHIWTESDSDGYSVCERCGTKDKPSVRITFSTVTINKDDETEKNDSGDIVTISEDDSVTTISKDDDIVVINKDDSSDDIVIIIVPDDTEEEEPVQENDENVPTRTVSKAYIGCQHGSTKTIKKGKYDCEKVQRCNYCGAEIRETHSYTITKDGCTYTRKCTYGCGNSESYTFHKHITSKVFSTGLFKFVKENGKMKLKFQMAACRCCTECGEIIEKKTWFVSSVSNYENEWDSEAYAIYSKGDEYPVMPSDWPNSVCSFINSN